MHGTTITITNNSFIKHYIRIEVADCIKSVMNVSGITQSLLQLFRRRQDEICQKRSRNWNIGIKNYISSYFVLRVKLAFLNIR
jgi:hypothetical protein